MKQDKKLHINANADVDIIKNAKQNITYKQLNMQRKNKKTAWILFFAVVVFFILIFFKKWR
jgi:hypothetical protein